MKYIQRIDDIVFSTGSVVFPPAYYIDEGAGVDKRIGQYVSPRRYVFNANIWQYQLPTLGVNVNATLDSAQTGFRVLGVLDHQWKNGDTFDISVHLQDRLGDITPGYTDRFEIFHDEVVVIDPPIPIVTLVKSNPDATIPDQINFTSELTHQFRNKFVHVNVPERELPDFQDYSSTLGTSLSGPVVFFVFLGELGTTTNTLRFGAHICQELYYADD